MLPSSFFSSFLRNIIFMYKCFDAAVSLVPDILLCLIDRCLCHLRVDRPCLCFNVVCASFLYRSVPNQNNQFHTSYSLFCRWPYPILDLSQQYAPLWLVTLFIQSSILRNDLVLLDTDVILEALMTNQKLKQIEISGAAGTQTARQMPWETMCSLVCIKIK